MTQDTMKREATKTISIILAALLFAGTAAADTPDIPSPGITPDSPFYALEKVSERLELAVAQAPVIGSEELEAKVRANHAAETLAEARAMAERNNTEQVEKLMNRYSKNMNKSIESASAANKTELKQRLRNVTNNQNNALAELDNKVPAQARKGIQKAMENNRNNQAKLGKARGKNPSVPGSDTPGKPDQGSERAPSGEESAPITGRSTAPENPSDEKQPENTDGEEKAPERLTGQSSQTSGENNQPSISPTEREQQSETSDSAGRGDRP